ncbi:MAG: hypothetical protein M8357_03500 [Desulfobulbaceae bacterium]|nr:hypothetical protein [Desulfobulbaceae bacterium]
MKSGPKIIVIVLIALCSFYGGYTFSARTGTEPGYFDAVEAAGYGGGGSEKIEGISDEMNEFYQSLREE